MSNVSEWSTTAGSNNSAPPDGAPELMLPGKVNDCMREMMAALAKWYKDSNATLLTAGTQPAYTLATNSSHAALSDIPLLVFRIHAANAGGACTLNVDGLGAKPLRKTGALDDFSAGDLTTGQVLVAAYNSATDDFEVIGPVTEPGAIPAGTVMLFAQTAAPTGWTKNTSTGNDSAIRLTTGTASTGGSTAFTSVFTSRTILQANLPAANLSHSLAAATHTHGGGSLAVSTTINNSTGVARNLSADSSNFQGGGVAAVTDLDFTSSTLTLENGSVTGTSGASGSLAVTGSVALGGSGTPVDFAVSYVDVIRATKD